MENQPINPIYTQHSYIGNAGAELIDDLSVSTDDAERITMAEYMSGASAPSVEFTDNTDHSGLTDTIGATNKIWDRSLTGCLPVKYRLNPLKAGEFLVMKIPERKKVLDPWLPERGVTMIYAERGVGKTYFSLEVAVAIATGEEFLGWQADQQRSVLYIDGEMCMSDLQQRLKQIYKGEVQDINDWMQLITPEMHPYGCPDLSDKDWLQALEPVVIDANVVFIDNISTLVRNGNENEADSWNTVQDWVVNLKSAGKTVVFVHHAGKSGQQRGTSKREDIMDTVINLKKPSDYVQSQGARFEVHFEKARSFSGDGAKPFEVQLSIDDGGTHWDSCDLEESNYEKSISLFNSGYRQKEVAEELGVDKSTASRYWKRAVTEGRCQSA